MYRIYVIGVRYKEYILSGAIPQKKIFGTRNPYDNRYGANIVRSGPKNSGDSEAIVIT